MEVHDVAVIRSFSDDSIVAGEVLKMEEGELRITIEGETHNYELSKEGNWFDVNDPTLPLDINIILFDEAFWRVTWEQDNSSCVSWDQVSTWTKNRTYDNFIDAFNSYKHLMVQKATRKNAGIGDIEIERVHSLSLSSDLEKQIEEAIQKRKDEIEISKSADKKAGEKVLEQKERAEYERLKEKYEGEKSK